MSRASKTGVRGLYRGADGAYHVDLRWTDPTTGEHRRYREKLAPKVAAEAAKRRAREILDAALAGTFDPNREAPTTVEAAFDRYLDHCTTHAIRSTRSRRTHAKAWVAFLGASRPLVELAAFDLERFKAHLRSKKKAPGTVNRHLATVKQLAAWAAREGILDRGKAAELREVKLLREPEGRVRWLSEDEERAIREKLTGWLRPIVLTAIGTGARRTEIAGLRWRDVDRAHGELVLTRTKSGRTRHVPLAPAVLAAIDAQPAGGPEAFVFHVPSRASRKPAAELRRSEEERRGDVVTKAWGAWCAKHGLADLRVHDLRHHAATAMRRAGHGLDVVAGVLGHSSLRATTRYAHVGRADLAAAVAAAASGLGGPENVAQPLPTAGVARSGKAAKP